MAKLKVDGKEIEVPDHYTLLQAAEEAGAEVPRFCFHERLSIAGNCRMCLIEVKGGPPKPSASCAMGVRDLRPGPNGEAPEIFTNTPMVKKAREGVMEFLLINHPLDCPICDQGGECDLQDQAMAFGVDSSRYKENKRAVEDKYIGPLVKTIMNRCIHCTRCVRFTTEVAGISELGLIGRGEDAEITTYLEHAMTSELQGNVIDLCPVGALTSRPYAFQARPWELTKTESIDVMDAVGSAIRVDSRGREVMRILPRTNEAVNEEWISDKTRFIWDGLRSQRLDRPYVRKGGRLVAASWPEAFAAIRDAVAKTTPERIGAIAGDLAAVEEMYALKLLMQSLGSKNIDCRQDGAALDPKYGRASYIFNPTIEGIERADAILIVGANPRFEASVLNARIRKRWRGGVVPVGVIGDIGDTRYDYQNLGAGADALKQLADGAGDFFERLQKAEHPLIIVGQGAIARADGAAVLGLAAKLAQAVNAVSADWNGFAVLHTAAARVGGLDIGFVPARGGNDAAGMLGATRRAVPAGRRRAGSGEGRQQQFRRLYRHAWRRRRAPRQRHPAGRRLHGKVRHLRQHRRPRADDQPRRLCAGRGEGRLGDPAGAVGCARPPPAVRFAGAAARQALCGIPASAAHRPGRRRPMRPISASWRRLSGKLGKDAFRSPVKDFYFTNPIARASAVMAECSALARSGFKQAAE